MKRYLRKVSKKSKSKFEHGISIPADIVKEFGLSESIVELKIKDCYFTVKKIGEQLDDVNSVNDTIKKNVTIHY